MTLKTFQKRRVVLCPLWQGNYGKERFYVTSQVCKICPENTGNFTDHSVGCPPFQKTCREYRTFKEHGVVLCPKWKGKSGKVRVYASPQNCQFCTYHSGNVIGIRSNCRFEESHGMRSKVDQSKYPRTKDIDGDGKVWHLVGGYASLTEARKVVSDIRKTGLSHGRGEFLTRILNTDLNHIVYTRRKKL